MSAATNRFALDNIRIMDVAKLVVRLAGVLAISACVLRPGPGQSPPPHLYSQPLHQSPVRGEPDDLLFLPGIGLHAADSVVYVALEDTNAPPAPPSTLPSTNSELGGLAAILNAPATGESLTVRLPKEVEAGQSYALWVHDESHGWSNPVLINDARPLWITPSRHYETATVASLPRYLKVVGRNLQAAAGQTTRVRLTGPTTMVLEAADDHDPSTDIEQFVAKVDLPSPLAPGEYGVEVSRDGHSWVTVPDQHLTVSDDPAAKPVFSVAAYGCEPDDDVDDIECIVSAIQAAQLAGGGRVLFSAGNWSIDDASAPGVTYRDGILVPPHVSLHGAGASSTTITTGAQWPVDMRTAIFTLQGHNQVRDIRFSDLRAHPPGAPSAAPTLQLGKAYYRVDPDDPSEPRSVDDVTISHNIFDRTWIAIGDGGLPIARLHVTYNRFGAYETALMPAGDPFNLSTPFRLDDSIISYNRFEPGAYLDVPNGQGTMASALGAGHHVDFSDNAADGASTEFLTDGEARGWRAGFFWHLNGSHEMVLVSRNTATCTGDKAGDGEAIAYDNNGGTFAFPRAQTVLGATEDSVTVPNELVSTQFGGNVPVDRYYIGHWVQVGQGPGVGQSRKIRSYAVDGDNVTFEVEPAWDVMPVAQQSRITVARQYWQVYTVDNHIDHRTPLCQKSNRTRPKGGVIVLWGQTADSAVSGNRQYDSDGILLNQSYSAQDIACPDCKAWTMQQSFVEIRDNLIVGEYDWASDCSMSGIGAWNGAAPTPDSPPVVSSYGVSIAHNVIQRADGLRGGAISVPLAWYQGPAPHDWTVVSNLLIHHNELIDIDGPLPPHSCDNEQQSRIGINLDRAELVWHTVLYANQCTKVDGPVHDSGQQTHRVCSSQLSNACECMP